MKFKSKITMDVTVLKKVARSVKKVAKTEIEWGWINGKAYNKSDINKRGGVPFALIAIRNEFGGYTLQPKMGKYVYIPSRPYFQQSISSSVTSTKQESAEMFRMALMGQDVKLKLQEIADEQVDVLKGSIARNNMKPLHPKTVAIKDSDKQWDDTGQMLKNITGKVIYKRAGYKGS